MESTAPPAVTTGPLSQRQYALRRKQMGLPGGSHVAVGNAVRSGRLTLSVNADGKIIDPALADREWVENTDHSEAPGSVLEKARVVPEPPARDPSRGGRPPKARAHEPPRGESGPPVLGQSLAENNAAKAYWQAKREELEYRKKAGELVLAADVDAKVRNVFSVTRTKLLTLPSRAKTLLGLDAGQVLQLEDLTREMLEELAAGEAA